MKKTIVYSMLLASLATACHESIEQRAEREAREYTEKYCPTPVENDAITDSIVFNTKTRTYITYITFTGMIDNRDAIEQNERTIRQEVLSQLRQNPGFKTYKDAGFIFEYICRSESDGKLLVHLRYTPKDYR